MLIFGIEVVERDQRNTKGTQMEGLLMQIANQRVFLNSLYIINIAYVLRKKIALLRTENHEFREYNSQFT